MKYIAFAAVTALGLSVAITPFAAAETFSECRERWEDDCALFAPRGSAGWASCVEFGIEFECQSLLGSTALDIEAWLGKLEY